VIGNDKSAILDVIHHTPNNMRNLKYYLAVLLFILVPFQIVLSQPADKAAEGISTERLNRYENYINKEIESGQIPGAATQIMYEGTVVYNKSFGYSSIKDKRLMKPDDIFFIQSMTKPIITVGFMMLYEEGHFQLTDPVSKYIPAFKNLRVIKNIDGGIKGETVPLKREILIADLLSHTAGFSHGISGSQFDKEFGAELFKPFKTIQERVDKLLQLPLLGQPGEQWAYSAAPDVLSVLIEKFSGQSTDQFLSERIFKPLGMKDTGYNLTKAQQARVVQVHGKSAAGSLISMTSQARMEGNTLWSGVNALFSTTDDYLKFCQMLINEGSLNGKQLLGRKTIELMTSNHSGKLFDKNGEGFGFGFAVVNDVSSTNNVGTNGTYYWAGAFNTHFFIDPKEKLIAVFMTQTTEFNWYYHDKLRQMVYQAIR
jgi:CubicO group peptidase (beta-lactamase class C family)